MKRIVPLVLLLFCVHAVKLTAHRSSAHGSPLSAHRSPLTVEPQDTLSTSSLGELVVSASRWYRPGEEQPVKVSRLAFEQSNAYNPQTAADMLGLTGEVFIQKSQYGGGSPMIRGFSANRLLYCVDGVRMNTAIFRAGNLQNVISLDPFAVSSTEVLFGPGSVCYGSDAIGGAMVFNTLQPRLSQDSSPVFYGSATLRGATASSEFTGHLHLGAGWRRWGFVTSFTTSSFSDLKQGLHGPEDYIMPYIVVPEYSMGGEVKDHVLANSNVRLQTPSGYSQYNFMQKVRYAPSGRWNMEYAFHMSRTSEYARYDRHQRMRNGKPRYAEWNYGPQEWTMNHLCVEHKGENAVYDSLRINLAMQLFKESRISRNLNDPLREVQTEDLDAWSANMDFSKNLTDDVTLSYGMEYVLNMVRSRGEGYDVTTGEKSVIPARYPKASWHSAGLYAQAEWRVHRTLNLEAGLRYNHYFIRNDFSTVGYDVPFAPLQSSDAGSVSGSAGLNWRPLPDWLFRVNYARGFRAPNVDDMGKLFDSVDGCVTVPNPFLKPEYADNIELGISKRFGPYLRLDFTAYYTHLSNAIVRRDYLFNGSPTMQYQGVECLVQALQNAAEANVWGIQAAVDSRFARYFYVKANVNWQRGFEELDNGQVSPSRHVAPLFGRASIGFDNRKLQAEVYTAFQAECDAASMPEEEKGKTEIYAKDANGNPYSPGWITLNMRLSYLILKGLHLHATLENLTDRRYRPYSSGISAPGRNVTFSLTYSL